MRLVILQTHNEVGDWSAKYVMKKINEFKPGPDRYFVIGLPTGETPLRMYKNLVEYHKEGLISFKYVKTMMGYEYVGEKNKIIC
jgi:glucosamine-6-phosphate deaminase